MGAPEGWSDWTVMPGTFRASYGPREPTRGAPTVPSPPFVAMEIFRIARPLRRAVLALQTCGSSRRRPPTMGGDRPAQPTSMRPRERLVLRKGIHACTTSVHVRVNRAVVLAMGHATTTRGPTGSATRGRSRRAVRIRRRCSGRLVSRRARCAPPRRISPCRRRSRGFRYFARAATGARMSPATEGADPRRPEWTASCAAV
jgi:hypothetical protein